LGPAAKAAELASTRMVAAVVRNVRFIGRLLFRLASSTDT
jgi:hypothetical protein